jgi:hypothetical protein
MNKNILIIAIMTMALTTITSAEIGIIDDFNRANGALGVALNGETWFGSGTHEV